MRSSLLALALLATLALGKPVAKREYVTEVDEVTVYTTVTENQSPAAATSTAVATSTPEAAPSPAAQAPAQGAEAPSPAAAAPATAQTAAAAPAAAASSNTGNSYQDTVINQHNLHRSNHSASALTWDNNLAAIAQQIASSCVYAHNTAAGGGGYGQNIGAGTEPQDVGKMITNEMYNGEINNYPTPYGNNNPDMSNFEEWGHYSQIVWQGTTSVGCATQYCSGGLANVGSDVPPYFTVCNYKPPGNFAGEYANVGQPEGQPSVTV